MSSTRRQFRVSTCARAARAGTPCTAACEPGRPQGVLLRAPPARHLATGKRNHPRRHMLTQDHIRIALACQAEQRAPAAAPSPAHAFLDGRGVGARGAGRPEARTIAALLARLSRPPFPTGLLHCDSASATTATTAEMPTSAKRIGHTIAADCLVVLFCQPPSRPFL